MKKFSFQASAVLVLVLFAALLFGVMRAAALDGTTSVQRLTKTHVEIQISSPGAFDPAGKYGGMLGGKYFRCEAVSADLLVCIGPFRAGSDPALFSVYEKSTKEIIFQQTVFPPRYFHEGDEEPTPLPPVDDCPPGDDFCWK